MWGDTSMTHHQGDGLPSWHQISAVMVSKEDIVHTLIFQGSSHMLPLWVPEQVCARIHQRSARGRPIVHTCVYVHMCTCVGIHRYVCIDIYGLIAVR